MKKILVSLVVLALCAPAMADVAITATGNGSDVEISIAVSGGAVVRGLALTLDSDGPTVGPTDAAVSIAAFNAYIDDYYANGVSTLPGSGTPLATVGAPGPITTDVVDAVLCMGVLDETDNQKGYGSDGDASGLLATITYDGTGNVCISEDTLRGGIVGDNLGTVTITGDTDNCVAVGGGPACWSSPCQPYGDANGDGFITSGDIQTLLLAWPPNAYEACSDFNHDGFITSGDIQTLLLVWGVGCP